VTGSSVKKCSTPPAASFFCSFRSYVGRMASKTRLRTSPLYFRAGFTEFLIKSPPLMLAFFVINTHADNNVACESCKLPSMKMPRRWGKSHPRYHWARMFAAEFCITRLCDERYTIPECISHSHDARKIGRAAVCFSSIHRVK